MIEPFHRTRPNHRNEYEQFFVDEGCKFVRHEKVIARVILDQPYVRNTTIIEIGDFWLSEHHDAKRRLQALLDAAA